MPPALCLSIAGPLLFAGAPPAEAEPESPVGPPADVAAISDGVVRTLAGLDRLPGTYLVKPDGLPQPIVVFDSRAGARFLSVRTHQPVASVMLLKNVRPGPPAESYARIAVPRPDRLAHLRKIALLDPAVNQAVEARGGALPNAAGRIRIVGQQSFYVMHGHPADAEVLPDDPPQVYVDTNLLLSIPTAAGETFVYYSPRARRGDPNRIAGELWQYRVPDDAAEGTGPRWVRTKPLTGGGSFQPMLQAFHPPEGL